MKEIWGDERFPALSMEQKGQTVQPELLPFRAGSVQPGPNLKSSRSECSWLV